MKPVFLFSFCVLVYAAGAAFPPPPAARSPARLSPQKTGALRPDQWAHKEELKKRPNLLTSPVMYRRLQRIYQLMSKKGLEDKTIALIQKLEQTAKNRPYDLARLYALKAQVYLAKEDFKTAGLFFIKALNMKELPYQDYLSVVYNMASLYLFQNKILEAETWINKWFELSDRPAPKAYILKAAVLVEKKQHKQALKWVMKAVKNPLTAQESWLVFAAGLEAELGHYASAAGFLETLVYRLPGKKKYWKHLSAVYLNIKKDDRSLAVLDLAYKLDFLDKEKEIVHLAGLLMYQGQPLKAARLMDKALQLKKIKATQKHYEILGDCWFHAEEMPLALKAYKLSARTAKAGNIFAKIGRIYLDQEQWLLAAQYFKLALARKTLKRPEFSYISIGIAYFNLKQPKKAIQFLEQVAAVKAKARWIKTAREWINYIHQQI